MFEYMIQGVARAGGVEMQAGTTILPQKVVEPRKPGIVQRFTNRLMMRVAKRLNNWSSRLLASATQTNDYSLHGHDAVVGIGSTRG